jgi:hypothetical protein
MHSNQMKKIIQPVVVLLYTLLYAAFFGFVSQPIPLGTLKPRLWRTIRFTDVRAAIRLVSDGIRNPNFIMLLCNQLFNLSQASSTNLLVLYSPYKRISFSFNTRNVSPGKSGPYTSCGSKI